MSLDGIREGLLFSISPMLIFVMRGIYALQRTFHHQTFLPYIPFSSAAQILFELFETYKVRSATATD